MRTDLPTTVDGHLFMVRMAKRRANQTVKVLEALDKQLKRIRGEILVARTSTAPTKLVSLDEKAISDMIEYLKPDQATDTDMYQLRFGHGYRL